MWLSLCCNYLIQNQVASAIQVQLEVGYPEVLEENGLHILVQHS